MKWLWRAFAKTGQVTHARQTKYSNYKMVNGFRPEEKEQGAYDGAEHYAKIRSLTARVKFTDHLPEVIAIKVGIDFSGGNGFMAQHFLDSPQVGATLYQMCCK